MSKEINAFGLDIGTNSCGYAVINDENEVITYNKRRAIGVRLFDTAETALSRRTKRSQRRMIERRNGRILLLQELFSTEISKIDKNFFNRLKYSSIYETYNKMNEENEKFLFDGHYSQEIDDNGKKKYPTIYHFRNKLINDKEKQDIRNIYLVIHHMMKYRGNFLYPKLEAKGRISQDDISKQFFEEFINLESEIKEYGVDIEHEIDLDIFFQDIEKPIDKVNAIKKQVKIYKSSADAIAKSILGGYKVNMKKLLNLSDYDGKEDFNFAKEDIDSILTDIESQYHEIILTLYNLYQMYTLYKVLKGKNYLSEIKIEQYNIFKDELKFLKEYIKRYHNDIYKDFFKGPTSKFNNFLKKHEKQVKKNVKVYDEFVKEIKNIIENDIKNGKVEEEYVNSKEFIGFKEKLDSKKLFLFQNNKENSVFPYQLNLNELYMIVDNQKEYYPFLDSILKKLEQIIEFRIPYFVGPLVRADNKGDFGWVERKSNESITPYNFNDVVDLEKSAMAFIKRMTGKCTYLLNEDVLPKSSLLYEEFMVLNEINGLRNEKEKGVRISIEEKNIIYNEMRRSGKRIKKNEIDKLLSDWFNKDYDVIGFQKENQTSTCFQYHYAFEKILDTVDSNKKMIEDLILWSTVLPDKKAFKTYVSNSPYANKLTVDQIKNISTIKCSGWGKMSKKLLSGIYNNDNLSIIEVMKNSDQLLMELIGNETLPFAKKISEINSKSLSDLTDYDKVQELKTSPANKRGILESLKIVDELIETCGVPKFIGIEMARSNEESVRTVDRKKQLEAKFKEANKSLWNIVDQNESKMTTKLKDIDEYKLKKEKIYLYFLQLGKCMYTGKEIILEELLSNNAKYDVDHIIPRTLVRDNSIDNKVLVINVDNKNKDVVGASKFIEDNYSKETLKKQTIIWKKLFDNNLISAKKYKNLKKFEFNESDISGFANRQLVETRQITKHVLNILSTKKELENTKIVAIKSGMVTSARNELGIPKNRDVNDKHHVIDAYLVASLAKVQAQYNNMQVIKRRRKKDYTVNNYATEVFEKIKKDPNKKKYNGIANYIVKEKLLKKNREVILKNIENADYNVTYRLNKKQTGVLWNENQVSRKGVESYKKEFIAVKNKIGDIATSNLLGAYTSAKTKSILVKKSKRKVTAQNITFSNNNLKQFKNDLILPINTLIENNKHQFLLISETEFRNFKQNKISIDVEKIISMNKKAFALILKDNSNTFMEDYTSFICKTIKKSRVYLNESKLNGIYKTINDFEQYVSAYVSKEQNISIDGLYAFYEKLSKNICSIANCHAGRVDDFTIEINGEKLKYNWKSAGRIKSKMLNEHTYVIFQSITGLKKSKIKLIDLLNKEETDEF